MSKAFSQSWKLELFQKYPKYSKTSQNFRFNCSEDYICHYSALLSFKAAVYMKKEVHKLRKAYMY